MKLVEVLRKLSGANVVVELKNGTVLSGVVAQVDMKMNTHLKNVRAVYKKQDPVRKNYAVVRGSSVRHFVLSDALPIDNILAEIAAADSKRREKEALVNQLAGSAQSAAAKPH